MKNRLSFTRGRDHPDNKQLNAPFSLEELKICLDICKKSAPGPDDITLPMLKHLNENSLETLLRAMNKLWNSKQYADDWSEDTKIPIYKPNKDPKNMANYRPISLTSNVCKIPY